MSGYKIAICDDEKDDIKAVQKLVLKFKEANKLELELFYFSNGADMLSTLNKKFDVIFLDIQMPGISGVETAKKIREKDAEVLLIFITALESYWNEGYDVRAFQFMLKPVDENAFNKIFGRAIAELKTKRQNISFRSGWETVNVLISDIMYFEIRGRKVVMTTRHGEYDTNGKMSAWVDEMKNYGFAQPHKSFLINLKYVLKIGKDEGIILRAGGREVKIPVSQRKYSEFINDFTIYGASK